MKFWFRFIKAQPWPSGALELPKTQVHRGFHRDGIRENTLEAFRKAKELGAQMCECDVRLSADQVPVIVHDEDLRRVNGTTDLVSHYDAKTLNTLGQIPTLQEMLQDRRSTSFFNIELKSRAAGDPLVRRVADVITALGAQERVMFSSFNPFALWLMQDYLPNIPRALLVTEENHADNSWWLKNMLAAPALELHMLNLEQSMLTEEALAFWQKQQVPISAWTVNDPSRAKKLLQSGVTSIISDLTPNSLLGDV